MRGSDKQKLCLVAAITRNGVIGMDNKLVWTDPIDHAHFKSLTIGGTVIMGRLTWDSLPNRFKPLPGRRNVVISRNAQFEVPSGVIIKSSVTEALTLFDGDCYIIGGAQIYAEALPFVTEMILTEVDVVREGNVYFPKWNRDEFVCSILSEHVDRDGNQFKIVRYMKMKKCC